MFTVYGIQADRQADRQTGRNALHTCTPNHYMYIQAKYLLFTAERLADAQIDATASLTHNYTPNH